MPPQNLVDPTIVDVSVPGVRLTDPDASLTVRPARDRQIEPEAAARVRSQEPRLARNSFPLCNARPNAPSGPRILGRASPSVARLADRPDHRETRDRDRLASQGLQALLDLEEPDENQTLIRRITSETPTCGAPRIHGELLKLGFDVAQATVSRYMPLQRKPPSQNWRVFPRNHTQDLVSIDFFVVPTAAFRVLHVFLVLEHERRRIVHFNVTESPSAQWTGQQLVNAFPDDSAPKYIIRDRDKLYGANFSRRVRAMGIDWKWITFK